MPFEFILGLTLGFIIGVLIKVLVKLTDNWNNSTEEIVNTQKLEDSTLEEENESTKINQ